MQYSTLVEVEVEVGKDLGKTKTSGGRHMMELSCYHEGSKWWSPHDGMRSFIFVHHEGSIIWSPHDVMRAPHDGALMMAWEVSFFSVVRAPSCGALMTSLGLHMTEPSCHHAGSTWWSPHDGMTRDFPCHHEGSIIWIPHDGMRAPPWGLQ